MLAVFLDGMLVRQVPDHMPEERARRLVDEAVVEGNVQGVVELKSYTPAAVPKRQYRRMAEKRLA